MFANSCNSLHTCILQHPLQQLLYHADTVLPTVTAQSDILRIKYAQLLQVFGYVFSSLTLKTIL